MGLFKSLAKGLLGGALMSGKKIAGLTSKAAPLIGTIPGVGTVAAAGLGAGGALFAGENIGTALKRGGAGALGGLGGGLLSKIGGLAGRGAAVKGAADSSSLIAQLVSGAGQVLGGENTGDNVRRLGELGIKGLSAVQNNAGQRNVADRSNALEAFFAQQSAEGDARLDALQQRLAASGTGRFN